MKLSNLGFTNKAKYLFFAITILSVFGIQAQNKNAKIPDSTLISNKAVSIGNFSDESEKLSKRIIQLEKILKPSAEISEIDSFLNEASIEVNIRKDSLIKSLDASSSRKLIVDKVFWENNRSKVKILQNILKDRTEDVIEINDEILSELKKWEQTKINLESASVSTDVYTSIDLIINTLKDILTLTHERLESIFTIQNRLTKIVLIIDDVIIEIKQIQLQLQKDYFVFDSEPIWKNNKIGISEIDNLDTVQLKMSEIIWSRMQQNKLQIKDFISRNMKTFILQILFILLLFVFMISVNNKWKKESKKITNPIEIQAKIVLSNPISATLVVGALISVFFYDALIPAFSELVIILILLGTVYLLPKLTNKSFQLFLILIFLVYLSYIFSTYLGDRSGITRILLLLDTIILGIALVLGRKIINKSSESFEQISKIYQVVSSFFIFILVVALVANIIGMVSLSRFLTFGALSSTILGMVVYLTVKVITSILILLFKLKRSLSIQTLSTFVNATHQRIQPILIWIGVLVWLMFTLDGFDLFDFIVDWFKESMSIHWKLGEMTISLGGILAFLGIFIVSLILAKLAATIFQDEWMVKTLPRGVAPAISLMMRIILVVIGLYMALIAAGIDLSRLGFMFGALGVGIGFGLQNVVLNFVAGLILAFERPINLGDTIEVDQEFGVVTSIGVRSSNIKSYSGYEAIIPNGDLITKKVINYTLTNRNRRSKIYMKTAASADPEKVINLFNEMANQHPNTKKIPAPKTYFYGYDSDGNLSFALLYWTTFSDTLKTDSAIALKIFAKLKEEGIQAPAPVRRIEGKK